MSDDRLDVERGSSLAFPRLRPRTDRGPSQRRAPAQRVVARRHGPRDSAVRRLLALADVAGVAIALAVAFVALSSTPQRFIWGLLTLPLWVVIFKSYGLYDRDIKRISHSTVDDLPWIFHSVLLGCLLLIGYFRLVPTTGMDLSNLVAFGVIVTTLVTGLRIAARRLALRLLGPERVLFVGEGSEIATLARKLRAHPEYGVEPVGFISRSESSPPGANGLPVLGRFVDLDLAHVVEAHRVERIIVAHESVEQQEVLLGLLRQSRELGVKMSFLPQLFDALGPSLEVDDVEGITVLGVNPPVLARSSRFLKRTMDIVGSVVVLIPASPLFLLISLAIKLDSRGPVFFRQERIGKGGRRFRLAKFRTMAVDAEERREALLCESKDPGWLLLDHDPRITRVGRVLRLSSLDELPQLWNVLKGEMSLVGPRPIIPSEDRQLAGWRRSRIDLTPGVTGLWQVLGRTSIPFEEMVKLDYLYVTNWSLWSDVRLILRTLPAVLVKRGAN